MPIVSRGRVVGTSISLLGAGLFALAWSSYRRGIHRARERVSAGSRIVETPCGPIEYGFTGNGPPVLVVHGAGGGFDQGLEIADPLVRSGFQVIAMSRFGYLRTPLPVDASPSAQADAHACLLDALDIDREPSSSFPGELYHVVVRGNERASLAYSTPWKSWRWSRGCPARGRYPPGRSARPFRLNAFREAQEPAR